MTIADNGRGGIAEEGNGLTGMRERMRALGGRLQIHSTRGQGTRLRVAVPLPVTVPAPAPAPTPASHADTLPLVPEAG
jgi:two-component system sensor histidine kinase DesK